MTVLSYLENTVQKFPNKTALESENCAITFEELRARAMSVGTYILNKKPDAKNRPVVIFLPKDVENVIAQVGALYSGNAYAPLDYKIPLARLKKTLENLNPLYIITDEPGVKTLYPLNLANETVLIYNEIVQTPPNQAKITEKLRDVLDTDPVYIMYTSGSSGTPKGVVIPHRGVFDYADWVVKTFGIDENTVFGNQSDFYFDNATLDIYCMLKTGAKLVIIPEILFMYPAKMPEYLNEKGITCLFFVPTVMISIANSGALENCKPEKLEKILFAGEVMPVKQLNIWRKALPDALFANLYGPTEITVDCTYYIVDREYENSQSLPIGIPCENMKIIILNEKDEAAKQGETGELCVAGTGLALGYWNAPELTERAFASNPLNKNWHERMYRTGDLAYVNEEGLIIYVGRKDSQIKFRGNRVELGDIENAAKSVDGVKNACVLFNREAEEIVIFAETELNLRQLNLKLKELLPKYMLPGKLIVMDALPLTPNSKIDRVRLRGLM